MKANYLLTNLGKLSPLLRELVLAMFDTLLEAK